MSYNQNANNNTREIAITRRPSLPQAPPTTGKMETTEVIHANFVERIEYSSCIPGKINTVGLDADTRPIIPLNQHS